MERKRGGIAKFQPQLQQHQQHKATPAGCVRINLLGVPLSAASLPLRVGVILDWLFLVHRGPCLWLQGAGIPEPGGWLS